MSDQQEDKDYAYLEEWRQGDFSLSVGGFLYGAPSTDGDAFDARETTEEILGLVVITQTCDIVRRTGGRHYVAVCPLIEVKEAEIKEVAKGRRPYLASVENTAENVFADLRRPFSVDKDLLREWDRKEGFSTEKTRVGFSASLERKFGQFAFPDEFDAALKNFKDRVWSRHDKGESPPGKVYRSVDQIRFRVLPSWEAVEKSITVIAVLHPADKRHVEIKEIVSELEKQLKKVKWPEGYKWDEPMFIAQTSDYLSAQDILDSQRGDFDFLCY